MTTIGRLAGPILKGPSSSNRGADSDVNKDLTFKAKELNFKAKELTKDKLDFVAKEVRLANHDTQLNNVTGHRPECTVPSLAPSFVISRVMRSLEFFYLKILVPKIISVGKYLFKLQLKMSGVFF